MKIAVISDIHGNMQALEAVLSDIEKNGCEKVFCLGDYAMAGPEPQKVLEWIFNNQFDSKFTMIQGNTDLMLINFNQELYDSLKEKAPVMAEALRKDSTLLNFLHKDFLKTLPEQKEEVIDGVKILLVHGSPRRNNEDILPDTPLSEIEKMLEHVDANIVVCGHTHIPCGFQTTSKKTVINVGSVGRPFTPNPQASYLIITINDGKYLFEHRFVKYDNLKAAEILKKRGFVGSEKLAQTLINPELRHF